MTADAGLAGTQAVVTGAGRGIGRAIALALVRAGAGVTLAARTEEELADVVEEAVALGGDAHSVPTDVTDPRAVERLVASARRRGRLRTLVNSAGVNRPGPTTELSVEDFDLVMNANVRGTFLTSRAVGAALLAEGAPGRIVNISSQMGAVGYPGRAAYCASKHAVNGLTKALAVEWAPHGITVNAVAPTFIRTPLTAPMLADDDFRADVLRRIPMGRIGEPEDVAEAVVFLASDAAGLMTGSIIPVDGGWVAW